MPPPRAAAGGSAPRATHEAHVADAQPHCPPAHCSMGWNTALDSNGTTYYWNEAGQSQYEKPPDFNEATAQAAGSYSQYAGSGGYGGGYDYSAIGLQYSRPVNNNYKDVQDGDPDRPADDSVAEFWRKNDVKVYGGSPPPFLSFEAANLPPQIMAAIHKAGFPAPSVIQAQTWPAAMAKRDVIGVAKTGSGKTLGFLVPGFLNVLAMRANPQVCDRRPRAHSASARAPRACVLRRPRPAPTRRLPTLP